MFLRSSALAVALVTAALVPQTGDDPISAAARIDESGMIFFAVLEGLYRDGVSNEAVDRILLCDPESGRYLHFVYACPICTPALDALRTYRNRAPFSGKKRFRDTFGPGLPPATIEALASEDIQVRLFAIESLMRSWVSRRLDGMRLTPEERAQWTRDFELGRKMGMSRLPSSASVPGRELVTTCAFCDAATGACHESASPAPPW
ncbi:MAG TPA: hypothetical protein VIE39_00255 [Thermoanaerobaculia bacterium]